MACESCGRSNAQPPVESPRCLPRRTLRVASVWMVRARLPWSAGQRLTTAESDEEEWRLRTQAAARPSPRALNLVTADEWTEWSTRLLALTHKRPADADLNDPSHEPPLDISSDQVRRYEEAVMAGLRNQLGSAPGRSVSQVVV